MNQPVTGRTRYRTPLALKVSSAMVALSGASAGAGLAASESSPPLGFGLVASAWILATLGALGIAVCLWRRPR